VVSVKYVYPSISQPNGSANEVEQWILGNTFPFVVFTSFGAFWLGYGATLVPAYGAYGNYADPTTQGSTGLESVGFNVGIGE
jgi:succinate-acetate transporter protein